MYPFTFLRTASLKSPDGNKSPNVFLIESMSVFKALAVTLKSFGNAAKFFDFLKILIHHLNNNLDLQENYALLYCIYLQMI